MARDLDPTRPLGRQVRRVARHQLREAITLLEAAIHQPASTAVATEASVVADAVHTARRNCKEVRSLLRLVAHEDGPTRRLDRATRDGARSLAPLRDAHVAAAVAARFAPGGALAVAAAAPRNGADDRAAIAAAVEHLERAMQLIDTTKMSGDVESLRRGLRDTYRRSGRAFERARRRPTPRRLHRWRTWNKRLWYQVRFLANTAPGALVPLAALLDLVGETLGDVHDLDVFLADADVVAPTGAGRDAMERERQELADRAVGWGAAIHAERPAEFTDRLVAPWRHAAERGPTSTR